MEMKMFKGWAEIITIFCPIPLKNSSVGRCCFKIFERSPPKNGLRICTSIKVSYARYSPPRTRRPRKCRWPEFVSTNF